SGYQSRRRSRLLNQFFSERQRGAERERFVGHFIEHLLDNYGSEPAWSQIVKVAAAEFRRVHRFGFVGHAEDEVRLAEFGLQGKTPWMISVSVPKDVRGGFVAGENDLADSDIVKARVSRPSFDELPPMTHRFSATDQVEGCGGRLSAPIEQEK